MRIYRDIIKTAWHVLWRYPWLWPLGLLAAVAGNGGEYGSLVAAIDRLSSQATIMEGLRSAVGTKEFTTGWADLWLNLSTHPGLMLWVILLGAVAVLAVIWIVIIAQAGIIAGAGAIDSGQKASFSRVVATGATKFWPIFCINLLAKFATYLLMAMAFLPFLASYLMGPTMSPSFDTLIVISFIIFVPLALVISFILKYAAIAIVLEGRSWWTALKEAVNLFFRNWLISLEMAALLFAINLAVGLVVFMLIPSWMSFDLLLLAGRFNLLNLLRIMPTVILTLVAGAWLATFQYAAWTILFRRLRAGGVVPKLLRFADDVPNYLERWFWPTPVAARPAARRRG